LTFTHLCTTFVDTDEEYAEEQQVDHAPNAKKENKKQKYYCVLIQGIYYLAVDTRNGLRQQPFGQQTSFCFEHRYEVSVESPF
jgi:hypothetical protein